MRILLYEHVSSGGYAGESIPPSLLSEGFAMLRGLTNDFKAAGHEITVLLDARIAAVNPPLNSDHLVQIASSKEVGSVLEKSAKNSEAAYVIAPESNRVLQSIVHHVEEMSTLSLNCKSEGIQQVADKQNLGIRARELGLSFPTTETCLVSDSPKDVERLIEDKLGFPVVVKPTHGAGTSGLTFARTRQDVAAALVKVKEETNGCRASLQKFIDGVPASVILFCDGRNVLPISLNLQEITLAGPNGVSSYDGGVVPLKHPLSDQAFSLAKRLTESFSGLIGYVGVDLILSDDKVTVIEVNPRLTTSYVGLRKVAHFNVAQAIFDAVAETELPNKSEIHGYSCFSKLKVSGSAIFDWRELWECNAIASPPLVWNEQGVSFALVQSYGETFIKASHRLRVAKNRFLKIFIGDDR